MALCASKAVAKGLGSPLGMGVHLEGYHASNPVTESDLLLWDGSRGPMNATEAAKRVAKLRTTQGETTSASGMPRSLTSCVDVVPASPWGTVDAALRASLSASGGARLVTITHANGGYGDMVRNMVRTAEGEGGEDGGEDGGEEAGVRVVVFGVDDALHAACEAWSRRGALCVRLRVVLLDCEVADAGGSSWVPQERWSEEALASEARQRDVETPEGYSERLEGGAAFYYRLLALGKVVLLRRVLERLEWLGVGPDAAAVYVDPDVVWTRRGGCLGDLAAAMADGALAVQEKHAQLALSRWRVGSGVLGARVGAHHLRWLLRPPAVRCAILGMTDEEVLELRIADVERTSGRPLFVDVHPLASRADVTAYDVDFGPGASRRRAAPRGVDTLSDLWEDAALSPIARSRNQSQPILRTLSPLLANTWLSWAVLRILAGAPLFPLLLKPAELHTDTLYTEAHTLHNEAPTLHPDAPTLHPDAPTLHAVPPTPPSPRSPSPLSPSPPTAFPAYRRALDRLHASEPLLSAWLRSQLEGDGAAQSARFCAERYGGPAATYANGELGGGSAAAVWDTSIVVDSEDEPPQSLAERVRFLVQRLRPFPRALWGVDGWAEAQRCSCLVHFNFLPPGKAWKVTAMQLENMWRPND